MALELGDALVEAVVEDRVRLLVQGGERRRGAGELLRRALEVELADRFGLFVAAGLAEADDHDGDERDDSEQHEDAAHLTFRLADRAGPAVIGGASQGRPAFTAGGQRRSL